MSKFICPYIKKINDKLLLIGIAYNREGPFFLVPEKYQNVELYHQEFLKKCPKKSTIVENGHRLLCLDLNEVLLKKYTNKNGDLMVEGEILEKEDLNEWNLSSNLSLSTTIGDLNTSTNIHDKLSLYKSKIKKFELFECETIDEFLFNVESVVQKDLNCVANDYFYHFLPRELLKWYYALNDENGIEWIEFKKLFREECLDLELKQIKRCKLDFVDYCNLRLKDDSSLHSEISKSPISFFVNEKIKLYEKIYKIKSGRSIALSGLPDEYHKRIRTKLNADNLSFEEYLKYEDSKYLKEKSKKT